MGVFSGGCEVCTVLDLKEKIRVENEHS